MARRKQEALDVPASAEEARELIALYVNGDRLMLQARLTYERRIDELKGERDALLARAAQDQTRLFAAIKAWWEAGGKKAAGRGRSAEIAGAKLGVRLTPPAVKLARGIKPEAVIAWLKRWTGSAAKGMIRTKVELDKPGIIKAAQAEDWVRAKLADGGVTVVQTDEFFIDTGLDPDAIRAEISQGVAA